MLKSCELWEISCLEFLLLLLVVVNFLLCLVLLLLLMLLFELFSLSFVARGLSIVELFDSLLSIGSFLLLCGVTVESYLIFDQLNGRVNLCYIIGRQEFDGLELVENFNSVSEILILWSLFFLFGLYLLFGTLFI